MYRCFRSIFLSTVVELTKETKADDDGTLKVAGTDHIVKVDNTDMRLDDSGNMVRQGNSSAPVKVATAITQVCHSRGTMYRYSVGEGRTCTVVCHSSAQVWELSKGLFRGES